MSSVADPAPALLHSGSRLRPCQGRCDRGPMVGLCRVAVGCMVLAGCGRIAVDKVASEPADAAQLDALVDAAIADASADADPTQRVAIYPMDEAITAGMV